MKQLHKKRCIHVKEGCEIIENYSKVSSVGTSAHNRADSEYPLSRAHS